MAPVPDHSALDAALAAQDTALQAYRGAPAAPTSTAEYDPLVDLLEVARVFKAMCAKGQIKSVHTLAAADRALAAFSEVA